MIFENICIPLAIICALLSVTLLIVWKKVWYSILALFLALIIVSPVIIYYSQPKSEIFKTSSNSLKIIQQNCWGRNHDPGKLINQIKDTQADVIFLQECRTSFAKKLTKDLEKNNYKIFVSPELTNTVVDTNHQITMVKGAVFVYKKLCPITPLQTIVLRFPEIENKVIHLVNVHLERPYIVDDKYYQQVIDHLSFLGETVILAGDFNLVPWAKSFEYILKSLNLTDSRTNFGYFPTYPIRLPLMNYKVKMPFTIFPIDTVLISRDLVSSSMEYISDIGSDHYGLILTIAVN